MPQHTRFSAPCRAGAGGGQTGPWSLVLGWWLMVDGWWGGVSPRRTRRRDGGRTGRRLEGAGRRDVGGRALASLALRGAGRMVQTLRLTGRRTRQVSFHFVVEQVIELFPAITTNRNDDSGRSGSGKQARDCGAAAYPSATRTRPASTMTIPVIRGAPGLSRSTKMPASTPSGRLIWRNAWR